MIRKRYLAAAGLLTLAVVAAGCGKKNDAGSVVQATPTPTEETSVSPTPTPEMVNMEETVEKNIMGEKTSTASKVTIVNQTGSEIAAIYIRETPSDDADEDTADEWGDDLVNGMFTLKSGDNAVYYYEKPQSASTIYDIRITYTDEEKNECFFRKLPLTTIKQITLRMDGKDEDAIPYATYMTANSTKEISTLNDVKKRLGLETDEDSDSVTQRHRMIPIILIIPIQIIRIRRRHHRITMATAAIIIQAAMILQIPRFRQQRNILACLLMISPEL